MQSTEMQLISILMSNEEHSIYYLMKELGVIYNINFINLIKGD